MIRVNVKAMGLIVGILLLLILQHSFPSDRIEKILNEIRPVLESEIVSGKYYSAEEVKGIIEDVVTVVVEEIDQEWLNDQVKSDKQIVDYWNEILQLRREKTNQFWFGFSIGVGAVGLLWIGEGIWSWIRTEK